MKYNMRNQITLPKVKTSKGLYPVFVKKLIKDTDMSESDFKKIFKTNQG